MVRTFAFLLAVSCVSNSYGQGILSRAGESLDNAGRNIRRGVENAVARGQASAQEQELVNLVSTRIRSDKRLVASVLQMEVRADGSVVLRGSVTDATAKKLAAELAENTVGVTSVVDELAVVKNVKVIKARPVVPAAPPSTTTTTTTVVKPQ